MGNQDKQIKDYWLNEYWPELQKANFDSENKLDTKLFAVASGTIGLLLGTLSFTEKHLAICEAMTALVLFGVSTIINIVYHYIATYNHQKQFDEITRLIHGEEATDEKIRRGNSGIVNERISTTIERSHSMISSH